MKSYELKPTYENLLYTFLEDAILRNTDIFRFVDILNSVEDCCAIALDGNWGCGKTFFVKQVKMVMDANNQVVADSDESVREKIIQKHLQYLSSREMELQPQICVYYDAWENDNDEDPMLSLVYNIMKSVDQDYSLKDTPNCLQLGASILEIFTGKDIGQFIEILRGDDPFTMLKKKKDIHRTINEFLENIMHERGNRLVVFIDELDRCKPEYAVKLLERVKHYFENDHISFVFSTNIKELQHTIKRYYGSDFNAYKYLDRFFDLRISLPKANYQKFYSLVNFNNSYYTYDIVCDVVIQLYHFELREVAKYLRLTKIAAHKVTHDNSYNSSFSSHPVQQGLQFCLLYIIPVMIGINIYDIDVYEELINGKNYRPLLEVFELLDDLFLKNELLNNNETYGTPNEGQIQVLLEDKIKELYNAIFVKRYSSAEFRKTVGKYMFDENTRETLLKVAGLFSKYTDLEEYEN